MQSAQNWHRQRATDSLDGTWDRRIGTEYQPIRVAVSRFGFAVGTGTHTWLYVGETGDLSDRPLSHERKPPYDRCAVCDSGDCVGAHSIDLDKETQIRWWHCADCGLVFQNPRLTGPSLRAFYAKADYFGLRGSNNRMLWDARGDLGRGLVGELTNGRGSCGLL